jgi:hypothetical protein
MRVRREDQSVDPEGRGGAQCGDGLVRAADDRRPVELSEFGLG